MARQLNKRQSKVCPLDQEKRVIPTFFLKYKEPSFQEFIKKMLLGENINEVTLHINEYLFRLYLSVSIKNTENPLNLDLCYEEKSHSFDVENKYAFKVCYDFESDRLISCDPVGNFYYYSNFFEYAMEHFFVSIPLVQQKKLVC